MAFEMPLDHIKQLQILLRKQANLSWYQPENDDRFTLPKLPSMAETIAELDPSPAYLRCRSCNGRLLRGLQSFTCVFCGTNPHKDLPPEPIKFKNTLGYRWLLESLELDGSEMVSPMVEENASNRGKRESKDEIPLSELLDLEIRWPSEAERTLNSNSDSSAFQGKSSLNLAGVDLDSFFDQRESDSNVFEQNLGSGREMGTASNNAFHANESLSLFQNIPPSEATTLSTEDQSGDLFSGWNADFKSASHGPVHEESKSLDHSKVDLDTVSGSWTGSVDVKKKDENDWFGGDGWRTSNTEVPSQTGKSESIMNISDTKTAESASGSYTRNSDWMQDNQLQGSDNKVTGTVASDEANDSFDAWNDFTGSASAQDSSSNISSSKITGQTAKSENTTDLNNSKTAEDANSSSNKDFDWMQDDQWQGGINKTADIIGTNEAADSFDAWNDFTGSATAQYSSNSISNIEVTGQTGKFELAKDPIDTKTAESATVSSRNFDWMQDDQWQGISNKATGVVTSNEVADTFDAWNDFTGSAITQNPPCSASNSEKNVQTGKSGIAFDLNETKTADGANTSSVKSFSWGHDDQWQVSSNKTDAVTTNEVADSFDVWNDFPSLATMQDPSSNVLKQGLNQTSVEQTSETNLVSSSDNSHDMDFSGFSQHDLFSEQFSSPLTSSAATNAQPAAASSNSVADVDAVRGNSTDVSTAKAGSKVDVETLMSQMHDLSFMLESNLSIPPK